LDYINNIDYPIGVCVSNKEKESYLYLLGVVPERTIRLSENVYLCPVISDPNPDDMIDAVMKNGSQTEFELGILIASLRATSAQIIIKNENLEDLAIDTWNSQTICFLLSALINHEIVWYFQSNVSADKFNSKSRVSLVNPHICKLPNDNKTLTLSDCEYIENNMSSLLSLSNNNSFYNAANALWCYNRNPRPAIQLSVIWAGIESLFQIEYNIKKQLSVSISRFLKGNDSMTDDIKQLYSCRSKAVHELYNGEESVVTSSANLLHQLIIKCVENEELPDYKLLISK